MVLRNSSYTILGSKKLDTTQFWLGMSMEMDKDGHFELKSSEMGQSYKSFPDRPLLRQASYQHW